MQIVRPTRDNYRMRVYRVRRKTGGWHNRRFGKNPRWADKGKKKADSRETLSQHDDECL